MAIRKRGDSWQIDVCVKGVRKSESRPTEALAKEREAVLKAELTLAKPERAKSPGWTLSEALEKTWERHWSKAKSQKSMAKITRALKSYWGADRDLGSITKENLDAWTKTLREKGNAGGTINRNLAGLSKAMHVAHEYSKLDAIPKFPREKEFTGRIRWATREEEATLVATLRQLGHNNEADACVVQVDTGMRCGELLNMEARDLSDGMISIWENKASLPRSVPMTERVAAVVERRRQAFKTGKLFPYSENWLRRPWDQVKVAMELSEDDQWVPHCLRHTFASRLVQNGVSILTVQKLLGHKTLAQTMRYAHLAKGDFIAAIAGLSGVTQPVARLA